MSKEEETMRQLHTDGHISSEELGEYLALQKKLKELRDIRSLYS